MSKAKVAGTIFMAFGLSACQESISESAAYCVRIDGTSFAIQSAATTPPTTLLTAANLRISAFNSALEGVGTQTDASNWGNWEGKTIFRADLDEQLCYVDVDSWLDNFFRTRFETARVYKLQPTQP